MEVRARLAPGREVGPDDFADLTPVAVQSVEWGEGGVLGVTFAEGITEDVADAVRRRIVSSGPRDETLRAEAEAYLSEPAPDLSEIRAQVARLSEIVLGRDQ